MFSSSCGGVGSAGVPRDWCRAQILPADREMVLHPKQELADCLSVFSVLDAPKTPRSSETKQATPLCFTPCLALCLHNYDLLNTLS